MYYRLRHITLSSNAIKLSTTTPPQPLQSRAGADLHGALRFSNSPESDFTDKLNLHLNLKGNDGVAFKTSLHIAM